MLMLPPISAGGKVERRVRARRMEDGRVPPEQPKAAVDPIPATGPEAESDARSTRKWGRRASDRQPAQEQDAPGAATARAPRAYAPLVAQLIASALGLEQTRARRRGSVAEATELYRRKRERPRRSRGEA